MVTVYINLKYRGAHDYESESGENSVSFFSLFPYGIFDSLFTNCRLQLNLHFLKIRDIAVMYLKEE